jgi:hypothetical protein
MSWRVRALEVRLTRHAAEKLRLLSNHSLKIRRELVEQSALEPERVIEGFGGRSIAEKRLDEEHVLRVVFVKEENQIRVITLYPARRGRY